MAAHETTVNVEIADMEPFKRFVGKVSQAERCFYGLTVDEVKALPARAAEGVTLLQEALREFGATAHDTHIDKIRNLRDVQGRDGTWNVSGYMRGLYNGLELALSILEGEREPQFRDAPSEDGGYLCDRPAVDMSGPEYEPVAD